MSSASPPPNSASKKLVNPSPSLRAVMRARASLKRWAANWLLSTIVMAWPIAG
jgi:hypothetical protein